MKNGVSILLKSMKNEKQKEGERLRLKLEKDQREYERLKRQFENKEGM